MTDKSPYVALKAFRFGAEPLQPGDPVPVESGRDYRLMQRLGQIGPASVTAPAEPQEPGEPPPLTSYIQGDPVVFVADDGAHTLVTFVEAMEAPEDAREGLGLEEGDLVAAVTFPEDPDTAVLVPLDSLLPEQPTGRLIEDLQAQLEDAQRAAPQGWTLPEDAVLVWVHEDGSHELLTFLGFEPVTGQETAARVRRMLEGEPQELTVGFTDLLPGRAATRLLAHEQERVAQAAEQGVQSTELAGQVADTQVQALQGRVGFLELLVQAIRAEGTPLKADTPALRDLQHNGILTEEGLRLLAAGEAGQANLEALDRVGAKKATQLREYLGPLSAEPSAED